MKDRIFYFLIFTLALLSVHGCASLGTYNPATGKSEFIFIPTAEEISLGQSLHQRILEEYKLSEDQAKIQRVNKIGQKLALVSDRQDYQYNFYLIEKDEMNAFTIPGGNIYFFSGLLDKLQSDDQVASVLAHEIGHCAARHTVKKFQAALGYDLINSLIMGALNVGEGTKRIINLSAGSLMNLVFSAYSRQDEYEADRLGVKYMYFSDYDPQAMIETFAILKKESKESGQTPLILRSHPFLDDRIKEAQKEIENVKTKFTQEH